jgi:hypothetical protein
MSERRRLYLSLPYAEQAERTEERSDRPDGVGPYLPVAGQTLRLISLLIRRCRRELRGSLREREPMEGTGVKVINDGTNWEQHDGNEAPDAHCLHEAIPDSPSRRHPLDSHYASTSIHH